ncbi:hypothetical protein HYV50_05520 [Candidatus Pacearchaeota archaeon]|nr:hypothetical protein [Candidatus Pacearchaeota archaeon]
MVKERDILLLGVLIIFLSLNFSSGFDFNGTVKDTNGNALNNSVVNITVRNSNFQIIGYNFTTTNASGWFNLTVAENSSWFYEPKITHTNGTFIDFIGQSLPAFPSLIYNTLSSTTFYLRDAGTINITAINSSGGRIAFRYQIKDQKLGYPIADNFESNVNEAIINIPRDRNYSIMIYPNQSMPVSFNWNNFSASSSYDVNSLSKYNFTTKTLQYQFNTTLQMKRVSGYINYSGISVWNEFTVVPYLLEPGNMVHATFGDMPYNLSAFVPDGGTDTHNLTSGFYNISLPGTAETSSILLFATARNGSNYYGGFRNLSLTLSSAAETTSFNFSLSGLLGTASNISMEKVDGTTINISTAKQSFNLVNTTNSTLSQTSAHIEATIDYSSFGALEFTWMEEIEQSASASFSLPLLNSTGIKEMNIYASGGDYSPKKTSPTVSQIQTNNNITISTFNPGEIDGTLAESSISMALYISNSTCDVPNPASSCLVGSSTTLDSFNPMSAIIGGGKLSFRMGTGGILVHYVNVDMLASGPPDALFDDSATTSTSGTFQSALRFGSLGPTIYDYVLVSIPYTEGSSSQTGLNESATVNISIPIFYDDNWNKMWNTTANGTSASALAGNYSHYSAKQSEWAYLLNQSTCGTNESTINITNPCYKDTSNNRIWVRLPHFSGTETQGSGSVITATSSNDSSSSSGGGGGDTNATTFWTVTFAHDDKELSEKGTINRKLKEKERIKIKVNATTHYIGVVKLTSTEATINVSSTPQQAVFNVNDTKKFDVTNDSYYDLSIKLNEISNSMANLTILYIQEQIPALPPTNITTNVTTAQNATDIEGDESDGFGWEWLWVIIVVVLLIIVGIAYYWTVRGNPFARWFGNRRQQGMMPPPNLVTNKKIIRA